MYGKSGNRYRETGNFSSFTHFENEMNGNYFQILTQFQNKIFRIFFKMAPNLFGNTATLFLEASEKSVSKEESIDSTKSDSKDKKSIKYPWKIVWRNVIAFAYLHIGALYGFYLFFSGAKFLTLLWSEYDEILFNNYV